MMVFLGDPVAVEKPAEKAVSLALAMRDAALTLSANWKKRGVDLGLAIGIDKGFATVGAIGFEGRVDYAAIGTVTNLACRLCQHARGGEIFLSQRVFSEVEGMVEARSEVASARILASAPVYRCDSLAAREVARNRFASEGLYVDQPPGSHPPALLPGAVERAVDAQLLKAGGSSLVLTRPAFSGSIPTAT
jgi:class 3 adenylate cyclase